MGKVANISKEVSMLFKETIKCMVVDEIFMIAKDVGFVWKGLVPFKPATGDHIITYDHIIPHDE